jgi:hypothetical protein
VLEGVMMRGVIDLGGGGQKACMTARLRSSMAPQATARTLPRRPPKPPPTLDGHGPNGAGHSPYATASNGALGEIETYTETFTSAIKRRRLYRLPIVRGVVALGESLKIGFKALGISANAQLPRGRAGDLGRAWGVTIALIADLRRRSFLRPACHDRELLEGLARQLGPVRRRREADRITIFLAYLWLISSCATCGACSSTTERSTR